MRRVVVGLVLLLMVSTAVWAQDEPRNEVSVQGTGFFTKETSDGGITASPTHSGGFLGTYRANFTKWVAAEGNYGYYRNSQKFLGTAGTAYVPTDTHEISGALVFKVPTESLVKPFALAGAGALVFDPRDTTTVDQQTRAAFIYGGGVDLAFHKNVSFRAQYRGLVYKAPDFDVVGIDSITHTAVPSAGIIFRF